MSPAWKLKRTCSVSRTWKPPNVDQRLPDVQAWLNELMSQKTCQENFSMEKLTPLLAQEAERAIQFMTATSAKC